MRIQLIRTARRSAAAAGVVLLGLTALAAGALALSGDLSPSFNGGKPVIVSAGPVGSATSLNGVAKQTDGKIVVVGSTDSGNGLGAGTWVIERLQTSGQPDPGFGSGGVVKLDMGNFSRATGVLVQPSDQRIVVGGTATVAGAGDAAFVRLNTDGSPDSSFGGTGKVILSRAGASVVTTGTVALGTDGKLFLAGSALSASQNVGVIAGVTSTGAPNGWHASGILIPNTGASGSRSISSVAVDGSGTVFYGGRMFDASFASHALLGAVSGSDGSAAAGFGSGGLFNPLGTGSAINGLVLASDGKLKAAIFVGATAGIASFNTSGADPTDTSFGSGGKTVVTPGGGANANALVEQNGELFAAITSAVASSSTQPSLLGANVKTGAPDTNLGPAGYRTYTIGASSYATGIADPVIVGVTDATLGGMGQGFAARIDNGLYADLAADVEVKGFGAKGAVASAIIGDMDRAGPFRRMEFMTQLLGGTTSAGAPSRQKNFSSDDPILFTSTFTNLGPTTPASAIVNVDLVGERQAVLVKGMPTVFNVFDSGPLDLGLDVVTADVKPAGVGIIDPDLANNSSTASFRVYDADPVRTDNLNALEALGQSLLQPPKTKSFDRAAGAAAIPRPRRTAPVDPALARLDHVEVAILREKDSAQAAAGASGKRAAKSCHWLAGASGGFRSTPAIKLPRKKTLLCVPTSTVWLRAKGKARWSLKFRKRLPAGKYVLYVRTVNRAGVSNATFGARKHTRLEVTIR